MRDIADFDGHYYEENRMQSRCKTHRWAVKPATTTDGRSLFGVLCSECSKTDLAFRTMSAAQERIGILNKAALQTTLGGYGPNRRARLVRAARKQVLQKGRAK